MKLQDISVSPIVTPPKGELSDQSLCTCCFCEKSTMLSFVSRRMCEKLSKGGQFFCQFCLRHGHNQKNARNTLILSFRSVIGHYYLTHYRKQGKIAKTMYLSQIEDFIKAHAEAGLTNPVFSYDPESYLWFVDFEKVGTGNRRQPIDGVKKTLISILACFNVVDNCPGLRMTALYKKYEEAIEIFYSQRNRPPDKKILSPTLIGCGVVETKECPYEKTREFSSADLIRQP